MSDESEHLIEQAEMLSADRPTRDQPRCPYQNKYGEIICIDGTLWALTYSECAPPDQRQAIDDCPHCKPYHRWRQIDEPKATPVAKEVK